MHTVQPIAALTQAATACTFTFQAACKPFALSAVQPAACKMLGILLRIEFAQINQTEKDSK
ncbi:hypothetical protein [Kingella kingae]|uniref:hypothetical protein n=1 Tax=Kingella kingae TaxID=504 RepID=UPI0004080B68|nr:hypothetical protein [Kingella kingae]